LGIRVECEHRLSAAIVCVPPWTMQDAREAAEAEAERLLAIKV
jgi:hypothetical protein